MLLKNSNIISKIKRSKVTDYAALMRVLFKISSAENHTLRTTITDSLRLSLYHLLYDITIILKKGFVYIIQVMHTHVEAH